VLIGGIGADTMNGDFGNDFLYGGDGDDTLNGGDGYDNISGVRTHNADTANGTGEDCM
jgi:Ca2+-binding RTX toxin-like protein